MTTGLSSWNCASEISVPLLAAGRVKSGAVGRASTSTSSDSVVDTSDVPGPGAWVGADSCPHATAMNAKTPISMIAATELMIFEMVLTGCSLILVQGVLFECSLG